MNIERTPLANNEYRATNEYGEMLRNRMDKATQPAAKRSLRLRLAKLLEERPEACVCDECVARWQEHG